MFTRT